MIDQLPNELRERFPQVVEDLRTGVIEEVPDTVLDRAVSGPNLEETDLRSIAGGEPTLLIFLRHLG